MSEHFLPFALPCIGEEEINEVVDTLRSGWLTAGPKVKRFEEEFVCYIGADYALAVNSCTAGLHLALEAIGIQPDDKVITSPYTFTATAEVIRYFGGHPIFVDIDPKTFNLDPKQVERCLQREKNVKAIMPVHFAGQACEMDTILQLAHAYQVKVVEDAAHAIPSLYDGRKVGNFGDITAYSFYVTKPLATGEGGMVVSNSPEYIEKMRIMRLHGITRDTFKRNASQHPNWYYEIVAPGFKYNMSDIMAAIGIHQLAKAEQFHQRRADIAAQYTTAFADLPLQTPYLHPKVGHYGHAWHLYVIQLQLENLKIDRDKFIVRMQEMGIGTSVHFIPLHIHHYWQSLYGFQPTDFPVALNAYQRAVSLPIYPSMTDNDVTRVISAVRTILQA